MQSARTTNQQESTMSVSDRIAKVVQNARLSVVAPGSDPGGSNRAALRSWLFDYANGHCALCGHKMTLEGKSDNPAFCNISHVIASSDSKRGMLPGAVFAGCRACNEATGDRDLTDILDKFANIAAIPTEWDSWADMRAMVANTDKRAETDIRREARKALGIDF